MRDFDFTVIAGYDEPRDEQQGTPCASNGSIQDDREDIGDRDTLVHESFHLGHSLLLCGRGYR